MQSVKIWRVGKRLQSASVELPHTFTGVHKAANACIELIELLDQEIESLGDLGVLVDLKNTDQHFTETEVTKLMALNRQLRALEHFIQSVAINKGDDVECRIQYLISQDAVLCPNGAKIVLTQRRECPVGLLEVQGNDFAERFRGVLGPEPHCYLFHDLYDHDYGHKSPKVSFRDCLRIDEILLTVAMTQQFTVSLTNSNASHIDAF